jgi:predicted polyphosphate/ATP-dependent NAD kinase
MIGAPMPNPRDSIIANLNQQLDQFFGAGRTVQEIAAGVTGEKEGMFGTSHSNKLRIERNKQAPRLKELAAGKTVIQAAKDMGMETKRARLIARENDIKFQGPP